MERCPRPYCGGRLFNDPDGRLYCHACGRAVQYEDNWWIMPPQTDDTIYGDPDAEEVRKRKKRLRRKTVRGP